MPASSVPKICHYFGPFLFYFDKNTTNIRAVQLVSNCGGLILAKSENGIWSYAGTHEKFKITPKWSGFGLFVVLHAMLKNRNIVIYKWNQMAKDAIQLHSRVFLNFQFIRVSNLVYIPFSDLAKVLSYCCWTNNTCCQPALHANGRSECRTLSER